MIRPTHIAQLLTYAAEELRIMTECGRHMEVSELAAELLDSASLVKAHVERAGHLRAASIMNAAALRAGEAYGVDPSRLSRAHTPEEKEARNAAIVIAGDTGMCATSHISSRFEISSARVLDIQSDKRGDPFPRSDIRFIRAKRMAMQNLLSGDGASVETTISGGGRG